MKMVVHNAELQHFNSGTFGTYGKNCIKNQKIFIAIKQIYPIYASLVDMIDHPSIKLSSLSHNLTFTYLSQIYVLTSLNSLRKRKMW